VSRILELLIAAVPDRIKEALPPGTKDALFNSLVRNVDRAAVLWRLIRRRRSKFISGYLDGLRGVEIGAGSHNRYYLDAINVDRYSSRETFYKNLERQLSGKAARVDVVANGDDLPFAENAYDFVFSSHVIEHFPDPIRALHEWVRVARRYVIAVVPHRDRTFDSERELSTVDELIERHRGGFTSEVDQHWSVWTCESFIDMCQAAGLSVVDYQDPDDKVGNGFTVVIDASAGVASPAGRAVPPGSGAISV